MSYDPNNIFAKILRGEAPCVKIYEDDHTLAMMDIMPQSDGHTLVLTKEPAATLFDMTPEGAAACIRTAQKVARAVRDVVRPEGVVVSQFNGAAAGQTVFHVHFHIVPRTAGEKLRGHGRDMVDPASLQPLADKLRAALAQA